jgi:putative NIF3 family GTP cyclohydrolase 1 type 2
LKLGKIYKEAIRIGMEKDPRDKEEIIKILETTKEEYEKLPDKEKQLFDKERLKNPYSDTRILWGDLEQEVNCALAGIDLEGQEILLADRLKKEKGINLLISHHPEGKALAFLHDVMKMQADILYNVGVPINIAEALLIERVEEVERRLLPVNHMRNVDMARLLNLAYICIHTPADNCVVSYLQKLMDDKKPRTVGDVLDILLENPEYRHAQENNFGPKIISGSKRSKCGKIFVDMTGGTEGSKDIFQSLVNAKVSTLVCMHLSEEHFKKAKEQHLNVIIAGHISSDTFGLNLLLDELMKKEKFEVIPCSGFIRVERG